MCRSFVCIQYSNASHFTWLPFISISVFRHTLFEYRICIYICSHFRCQMKRMYLSLSRRFICFSSWKMHQSSTTHLELIDRLKWWLQFFICKIGIWHLFNLIATQSHRNLNLILTFGNCTKWNCWWKCWLHTERRLMWSLLVLRDHIKQKSTYESFQLLDLNCKWVKWVVYQLKLCARAQYFVSLVWFCTAISPTNWPDYEFKAIANSCILIPNSETIHNEIGCRPHFHTICLRNS